MLMRTAVSLAATLFLATGCSDLGETAEPECGPDAACGDPEQIPDVEHQELRSAYKELINAGYEVRFTEQLENDGYAEYARDGSIGIQPRPWVGDTDPEPGEPPHKGGVTITAIECPNRAESCD